jgi:hypothetical protein
MAKRDLVPNARTAITLTFDKELQTSRGSYGLELGWEGFTRTIQGKKYPKRLCPTMQVPAGTT